MQTDAEMAADLEAIGVGRGLHAGDVERLTDEQRERLLRLLDRLYGAVRPPAQEVEYVFLEDRLGDWYVCPADKRGDAYSFLDRVQRAKDYVKGTALRDAVNPKWPEWLTPLRGGIPSVRFRSYRVV